MTWTLQPDRRTFPPPLCALQPANLCCLHGDTLSDPKRVYLVDYGFVKPSDPGLQQSKGSAGAG